MSSRILPLAVAVLLISACSSPARNDRPAEVEERGGGKPVTSDHREPQIAAYTPPAQPSVARPAPKRAVEVLMARAEDQQRSGDLDAATVSLERALRIAPDDAILWHRLAGVRSAQRRHELVIQLAAKSNALAAPGDRDLRHRNWQLIADAKRALGDAAGANEAAMRAAEVR